MKWWVEYNWTFVQFWYLQLRRIHLWGQWARARRWVATESWWGWGMRFGEWAAIEWFVGLEKIKRYKNGNQILYSIPHSPVESGGTESKSWPAAETAPGDSEVGTSAGCTSKSWSGYSETDKGIANGLRNVWQTMTWKYVPLWLIRIQSNPPNGLPNNIPICLRDQPLATPIL